jgi:hypothetical protein
MSLIQRLFKGLLPRRWADDMEAHSRAWKIRCNHCGHERSVWEIGGIRWRSAGNPRWLMRCPNCGRRSWHKVYQADEPASPHPPRPAGPENR